MKLSAFLAGMKALKNLPLKRTLGGVTAAAALTFSVFSTHHEGLEVVSYLDGANVATICEGHTSGVKLGTEATLQQCREFKASDEAIAFHYVNKYVQVPLHDYERAAYASFVNNLGAGRFRDSTMLKLLNGGYYHDACEQFSRWVYIGKKDCRLKENKCGGIPVRREEERQLCHGKLPWYFFGARRPWWVF